MSTQNWGAWAGAGVGLTLRKGNLRSAARPPPSLSLLILGRISNGLFACCAGALVSSEHVVVRHACLVGDVEAREHSDDAAEHRHQPVQNPSLIHFLYILTYTHDTLSGRERREVPPGFIFVCTCGGETEYPHATT